MSNGTGIIINPGTEPLATSSEDAATRSMEALLKDLADGASASFVRDADCDYDATYEDGRYAFALTYRDQDFEIQMPGWEPEKVRFTGEGDQNIWDYPRLYVNGNSWVWKYALGIIEDGDE